MPKQWNRGVLESGQLKVYNKGGGWSPAVDAAIASFNNLGFPVRLVAVKEESAANIVVKLCESRVEKQTSKRMIRFFCL